MPTTPYPYLIFYEATETEMGLTEGLEAGRFTLSKWSCRAAAVVKAAVAKVMGQVPTSRTLFQAYPQRVLSRRAAGGTQ